MKIGRNFARVLRIGGYSGKSARKKGYIFAA
jgi:hypothetical protein